MIHTLRFSPTGFWSTLAAALLVVLTWTAPATAQDSAVASDIRQMLEQRDRQIKSILQGSSDYTQAQREELKTLINGVIDFRAMGQIALGPFWGDLSAEQRTEFVSVFRDIVRAQSLADLGVYNSKVQFDAITVEGDSAFVRTTTTYEGTQTPVEYVLHQSEGEWVAEDIVVDGVSTAESYARSFQTVIRKRGFDALMKTLRKKQESVTADRTP